MKQKSGNFLDGKSAKIAKQSHAFKGYASSYNVEILNFLNLEPQFRDSEFANRNKLICLFSECQGFKFVTTLVLELKKIESDDKTKYDIFYSNSKQKQLLMKVTFVTYLNQSILSYIKHAKIYRKNFRLDY